jgi:ELWxxDGT repeat protein
MKKRATVCLGLSLLVLLGVISYWLIAENSGRATDKGVATGTVVPAEQARLEPLPNPQMLPAGAGAGVVVAAGRPLFEVLKRLPEPKVVEESPLALAKPVPSSVLAVTRSMLVAAESIADLSRLRVGDEVKFPLSERRLIKGRVTFREVEPDSGAVHLAGVLGQQEGERFFMRWSAGKARATLLLPGERRAFLLQPGEAGSYLLQEKPIDAVLCFGMPRAPGETEEMAGEGELPLSSVMAPNLDSLPSATEVLYLDFDGETVTDPAWNSGATVVAAAATLAGQPISEAQMTEVWEMVAEDFRPFNVSVTTIASRYWDAPENRRMRCIITPTDTAAPMSGGVAYLNSFSRSVGDFSPSIPCWSFNQNNTRNMAMTISHELGHTLGLSHDGRDAWTTADDPPQTFPAEIYYAGHGTGATSWGPIMGAPFNRPLTQWSRGEYFRADRLEDDVALIARPTNTFGYRADEAGDTPGTAKMMTVGAGGAIMEVGVIHSAADRDYFRFTSLGGELQVSCAPSPTEPNLKVRLELRNASDELIATAPDPTASTLSATLQQSLAPGVYDLVVSAGDYGDPEAVFPAEPTGFTRYGSLGSYSLQGSVPNGFLVSHPASLEIGGEPGGPFSPDEANYTITNNDSVPVVWTVSANQPWLTLSSPGGSLAAGDQAVVQVELNAQAATLPLGSYQATLLFTNVTHGNQVSRQVSLTVGGLANLAFEFPIGTPLVPGAAVLDFNHLLVGTRDGRKLAMRNLGTAPLLVESMTVTGASGFTIGPPPLTPVPAGGVIFLDVICAPTAVGPMQAILQVESNASNHPSYQIGLVAHGVSAPGTIDLVRVLSSDFAGLNPTNLLEMNGYVLFAATTPAAGTELWRSDGTAAGTFQLADIWPGATGGFSFNLTRVGNQAFFSARTSAAGMELWVTDGTAAGTRLVRDIFPGSIGSSPSQLTALNGILYFTALTSTQGAELWRSDGTNAGTTLVRDIRLGNMSSAPQDLVVMNNALYFVANDGTHGAELWRSDGTVGGTFMVRDVFAGPDGSGSAHLTAVGMTLFFVADDGIIGTELWKTDGTPAGTQLVKDVEEGAAGAALESLTALNGLLYFRATTAEHGAELWRSDGSSAGTNLVKDIQLGTASGLVQGLSVHDNQLFFAADDGVNGVELWKSDGTSAGTLLVKDVRLGSDSASPTHLTSVGSTLFFSAQTEAGWELWRSDGTAAGTWQVKDIATGVASSFPTQLSRLGELLLFSANDQVTGRELWRSDGTDAGTYPVGMGLPGVAGSNLTNLRNVNGQLYFSGTNGTQGAELWRSDGSFAGTNLVSDINSGSASSHPDQMMALGPEPGAAFVFAATTPALGRELYRSDGTAGGTTLVRDIAPGAVSSSPANFLRIGSTVFFTANDGVNGVELWKTDGTEAGTQMVADLNPGVASSGAANLVDFNGVLVFSASSEMTGQELWRSDGTAAGTYLLKDIRQGIESSLPTPSAAAVVGNELFFAAFMDEEGRELWKTDGTEAGTVRVRDIAPGSGSSTPSNLTRLGGVLLFAASDGSSGVELWRSDGTEGGTFRLRDISPGVFSSSVNGLLSVGDFALFAATDGTTGMELWRSDGTPNGTVRVRDIAQGSISSSPTQFTMVNGLLMFRATTPEHGTELWTTDGTEAGTRLVADLFPGVDSSIPSNLTPVGSRLFFTATHPQTANQLFVLETAGSGQLTVEQPIGVALANGASQVTFAPTLVAGNRSLSFQLVNTGWGPLILGNVGITGPDAAVFVAGDLSATVLQPGGVATLTVTFSPSAVQTHTATLQIASDDAGVPLFLIGLSGDGLPVPTLVLEQPAGAPLTHEVSVVDFGAGTLADEPVSRVFRVLNGAASAPLQVNQVSLVGPQAADFSIENSPSGNALSGSQTRSFTVRFSPRGSGVRTATLSLTSNDPLTPSFSVQLSGTGVVSAGPGQEVVIDAIAPRSPSAGPFQLPAYASSGQPLSYEVLVGPAMVDAGGWVTPTGASGAVTVRVFQPGGAGYDPVEGYATFSLVAWPAFTRIAAKTHSRAYAAIRNDGTLWTWGVANFVGTLGDPTGFGRVTPTQVGTLNDWTAVTMGESFGLGLRSNGTLWAWGQNSNGQLGNGTLFHSTAPVAASTIRFWRQVSAGRAFAAAIATNGTLWTWGANNLGQLGLGDNSQRLSPTQVGTDNRWEKVSCGSDFMVAVKTNGELWAWGFNSSGQLGSDMTFAQNTPIQIGTASDWVDAAAGFGHVLALRADGSLWGWGLNSSGQLGIGNSINQLLPVRVGTDADWDRISCGVVNSAARKRNGTIWAWGANQQGQLGVNAGAQLTSPQPFLPGHDWLDIQAGDSNLTALRSDGQVWVAGEGDGLTGVSPRALTRATVATVNWSKLAGRSAHFMALDADGVMWGWGRGGAFGNGSSADVFHPTQQAAGQSWLAVSTSALSTTSSNAYSLAIRSDGSLWATGVNSQGNLGDGTTTNRTTWVPVQPGVSWSEVSAGVGFAVGVRSNGTLWSWGVNNLGQLGQGITGPTWVTAPVQVGVSNQWRSVAAGISHVAAIRQDGTLWTWGNSAFGQLGHGNQFSQSSPVRVGFDNDWVAVACGDHTLALKADGSLWSWGRNDGGQLGLGYTASRNVPTRVGAATHWAKIAAGPFDSAALTTTGELWTAGQNLTGSVGNGSTTSQLSFTAIGPAGFDQIAVGQKTLVATRTDGSVWTAGTSGPELLGGGRPPEVAAPVLPALSSQSIIPPPLGALSGRVSSTSGLPVVVTLLSGPGVVEGDQVNHTGPEGSVATFLAWQPGDAHVWNAAPPVRFSIIRAEGEIQLFEGTLAGQELQSGTNEVAFGTVLVGGSATRLFTIVNSGPGPLVISNISATGDWSLNLSGTQLGLQPGTSTTFTANFSPTVTGERTGQIVIASNDQDEAVFMLPLRGNGGLAQTLTFNTIPTQVCGTPLVLNATASSGLPVQYAITAGVAIATLQNGVVTFTSSGSVTIQAVQPGNNTFVAAAPISRSFSVIRGNQTLTFGPQVPESVNFRTTVNLSASSDRGLTPIQFSRISGPGTLVGTTLTFTTPGAVVIRASQTGNAAFNPSIQDRTIIATNNLPVMLPLAAQGNEDTTISSQVTGTDVDGDTLVFAKFSDPAHGSVNVASNGSFTYTPSPDYNGQDSFQVRAFDGHEWSIPVQVTITIFPINDRPLAIGQNLAIPDSSPLPITLIGTDVDGDELTFQIVEAPSHGNLTGSPPEVSYTSNPGYAGPDSFQFKVRDGSLDSTPAVVALTVTPVAPSIITPPADLALGLTGSGQLQVVANGSRPLTYQWFRDGTALQDQIADTLAFADASPADVGSYHCVVTNSVGSVTSPSARLEVITDVPRILQQPTPMLVQTGAPLQLRVVAVGAPPLRYQWRKNGIPIPGATGPRLLYGTASLPLAGAYSVTVTAAQTVASETVQVGVVDSESDTLVQQEGTQALLKVKAAGRDLQYQWQRDGQPLPNDPRFQPSADGRSLVIRALQIGDAALYRCQVTGPGGVLHGTITDLGVFNTAPTLVQPQTLPQGIVGGVYQHQIQTAPGAGNRPSRYRAVGLPPGLKLDPKTGWITGQPTKPGFFSVRMSVSNRRSSPTLTETLEIAALPDHLVGSYTGIVARSSLNQQLGGVLNFKVTQSAAYSGQVEFAGTKLRFKGMVEVDKAGLLPPKIVATLLRPSRPAPLPLTLEFEIATSPGQLAAGRLYDDIAEATVEGWRQTFHRRSNPATVRQGYHTFALQPQVAPGETELPQGSGFGAFTLSTAGTLGIAGRLPDGTAFTRSTFVGPAGQIGLFSLLYGPGQRRGSLVGILTQGLGENPNNPADNPLYGSLYWSRPAQAIRGSLVYPAGFAPVQLAVSGGYFQPPSSLLGLSPGINIAQLAFSEGGLSFSTSDPSVGVSTDATNEIRLRLSGVRVTLVTSPNRSAFSGLFELSDPHWNPASSVPWIRRVPFQGMIILSDGRYSGHGFFLLPQLPLGDPRTNPPPTRSGRVSFQSTPAP